MRLFVRVVGGLLSALGVLVSVIRNWLGSEVSTVPGTDDASTIILVHHCLVQGGGLFATLSSVMVPHYAILLVALLSVPVPILLKALLPLVLFIPRWVLQSRLRDAAEDPMVVNDLMQQVIAQLIREVLTILFV